MKLPSMKDYAQSPSNRGWLNKAGHTDGSAIDIGWRTNPNNPNQPAYALTDAKVLEVGFMSDGGNVIVAGASYNDTQDMWWSVQHLQSLSSFKKGDELKQGQQFGNMGNTGKSNGEHFHVRISLVPKDSKFSWATFNSHRVDPIDYVFAYAHQDVTDLKKKPSTPFIEPNSGKLTNEKVAVEVIAGKCSTGAARVKKLTDSGYDAKVIQSLVNKIMNTGSTPKPKPPVTNIGKFANLGGKMWLFEVSRTDRTYHPRGMGYNQLQDIRKRSAKILEEDNGRVKISVPSFNPKTVWVAKSQISITDKALHAID